MGYVTVDEPFDTKYDACVIAFCPDPGFWFATDERHWYYQYKTEFQSYTEAYNYFCNHISEFIKIQKELKCSFYKDEYIEALFSTLCMCDPTEDYGDGPECQFCHAKPGGIHTEDCDYAVLTNFHGNLKAFHKAFPNLPKPPEPIKKTEDFSTREKK